MEGDVEIIVAPGDDTSLLAAALTDLPAGLRFVEAYGDVEIILCFRPFRPATPDS